MAVVMAEHHQTLLGVQAPLIQAVEVEVVVMTQYQQMAVQAVQA